MEQTRLYKALYIQNNVFNWLLPIQLTHQSQGGLMRINEIQLEEVNFPDFIWKEKISRTRYSASLSRKEIYWELFYKDTNRALGRIEKKEVNRKDGTIKYKCLSSVEKLSGDFKFEEDDLDVAKFKVKVKVIEKLKEMKEHPKKRYYEIY